MIALSQSDSFGRYHFFEAMVYPQKHLGVD